MPINSCKKLPVKVRYLGLCDYAVVLQAMQQFTAERQQDTADEIWCLEHQPVFTQGMTAQPSDILVPGLPVLQSDRGGQLTYHGPGQLVVYCLFDLARRAWGLAELLAGLHAGLLATLRTYGILAYERAGAPGLYVAEGKVAFLGLKVRRGCSYHGLSLNLAGVDLGAFACINPCGQPNLLVTQISDLLPKGQCPSMQTVTELLLLELGKYWQLQLLRV
jgi:lipoyl(octanoyl) transferase